MSVDIETFQIYLIEYIICSGKKWKMRFISQYFNINDMKLS